MRADKIYLVGFMGAGKSTLAAALGARLQWRVEDLDAVIERRHGMSVAEIFATHGESYFRKTELATLRDLRPVRRAVVATGGGAFVAPENRALINRDGVSFWLDVSLRVVTARLAAHDGGRPLAADRPDMARRFHARQAAYRQAHVRLDGEQATTSELVDQVVEWLRHRPLAS